jgi:beta-phosphoglucomutase-like phosphatase (HAD superfamily)
MTYPIHSKPSALLFDFDNLLIDSKECYRDLHWAVRTHMQTAFGAEPCDQPPVMQSGETDEAYLRRLYRHVSDPEAAASYYRECIAQGHVTFKFRPGGRDLICYAMAQKIPYVIVSDTDHDVLQHLVRHMFKRAGFRSVPPAIGHREGVVDKKPSPQGIIAALRILSSAGQRILPNQQVWMVGDLAHKDGEAAKNAGVSAVIIPHPKSKHPVPEDCINLPDLSALKVALTLACSPRTRKLQFHHRQPLKLPREMYEVIRSPREYVESPDMAMLKTMPPEEVAFHEARWAAKKGASIDGTRKYTVKEQIAAAQSVTHELLTDDMVQHIAERITPVVLERASAKSGKPIMVQVPHFITLPPKPTPNYLKIVMTEMVASKLGAYFAKHYPKINVQFQTHSYLPTVTLNHVVSQELGPKYIGAASLSGHRLDKTSTQGRTDGNLFERLVKQPLYELEGFQEGDIVVLVDDHLQAASTIAAALYGLEEKGVSVPCIAALSTLGESRNIQPHPEIDQIMAQALQYAIDNHLATNPYQRPESVITKMREVHTRVLEKIGLSDNTLTNREALILIAHYVDYHNPDQKAWFDQTAGKMGFNASLPERGDESIKNQLQQPPLSPLDLCDQLNRAIPTYHMIKRTA